MIIPQKTKTVFLILVLVQGLHSIEEYIGQLWINFIPARILCGLISNDLETGFLVINIGLFIAGMLAWLIPIRNNYAIGIGFIWFWIILELINGIGHPIWTIMEGGYTPGVVTAPLLLGLAVYLLKLR